MQAGRCAYPKKKKEEESRVGLRGSVGGSVAAGDAAEHHEVAHGIAADAVAANGYGIGFLSGELLEHLNNAVPFNAFSAPGLHPPAGVGGSLAGRELSAPVRVGVHRADGTAGKPEIQQ